MIKKTPKQQKTDISEDPTISPVATSDAAVPSSSSESEEALATATPPATPPTPPAPPTPPTPPTPTPPAPPTAGSPSIKPAQLVILKKAGDRSPSPSSERSFEPSSERRFERRPVPAPTKAPAQLSQCGKYKAGDEIVLPYSGQKVALTYFYQSVNLEEFWGAFEGGCVRLSALP